MQNSALPQEPEKTDKQICNKMAKKRFDIKNNILGGAFLTRSQMAGQWMFILYIFLLIFLYITLNLAVINTQKASSHNLKELKNLKADYTSKEAKLQAQSSRGEILLRLKESGSTLKDPSEPARRVKKYSSQAKGL